MDITDLIIIMLLISIFFLCLIGFVVYLLNIKHQTKMIDTKLFTIQSQKNPVHIPIDSEKNPNEDNNVHQMPINIHTRGLETYRQIGVITSLKDTKKVLPLHGRRIYTGSQNWNYYTSTDGYQSFQVSIIHKNKECSEEYGCSEIYSNDNVFVPAYDESFRVLMYKSRAPRYIPYIT